MIIEKRLKEMGIQLFEDVNASANYVPYVKTGNLIFVSGQTPKIGSEYIYTGIVGKDATIEDAGKAAELCCLRLISVLNIATNGNLDKVKKIVNLTGYINAVPGFEKHASIIDYASDLLFKVFEEKGRHSRAAIGIGSLPKNSCVEISMIVEVED